MSAKKRLDVLLVERGLAETRSQAQALVLAGRVRGHSKAGEQIDEAAELEVSAGRRFVSRGGEKLSGALAELEVDVAGELRVVDLCTLEASFDGETHPAVNDVVVTSSRPGRMVQLGWQVAGEDLGDQPCDGMICCTPSGSTAYNLSNGGPVLMWGLEAMAMTFVAPHSLRARALVVPRGLDLRITNRSKELPVTVLVDGHAVGELERGEEIAVVVARDHCRLAVLPEVTFFTRYHEVFP